MFKAGFSLLEMLAVLFVLSLLLTLLEPGQINSLRIKVEEKSYILALVQLVNLYKERAILENTNYSIIFDSSQENISIVNEDQDEIVEHIQLPSSWDLEDSLRLNYFSDGRISDFRAIQFYHQQLDQCFVLRFQLGSGIFVLAEEDL